ncbi:hypothetical protein D9619_004690 [Psilocybe cf. subviscida]|uniref:F-box domain-containing protein n=1 Tax=Psilocybe cf. subviscida TaxID=2480587 RepID=A0A8H5BQE1_9AGAR|nr:hypothetical protein D9619_004690 [Psilocybe cf. subviscida]
MRPLPDDVLRGLFEFCRVDDIIPSILDPHIAPVLLTHVSRRWQKIAHSTPKLWSSISITFRRGDKGSSKDHPLNAQDLEERRLAMQRWLGFSGTCPLSIQFVSSDLYAQDEARQFFRFLIGTTPRWQRLSFTSTHGQSEGLPMEFAQALLSINLPLLETLEFGDFASVIRPNSLLLSGQRLHGVSYLCSTHDWSVDCPNQLSHLNIRWSYLTSLKLSCGTSRHSLDDYFTVLRRCSSLVNLSITEEHFHPRTSSPEDLAPVLLPHLQSLSLCLSYSAIETCFHVLNTPALEDLSFRWHLRHSHSPDSLSSSLFSFLSMSRLANNNKIRRLALDPMQLTRVAFYRLLDSFPFLDELSCRTDFDRETQRFTHILGTTTSSDDSHLDDTFLQMLSGISSSADLQSTTHGLAQRRAGVSMRLLPLMPSGCIPVLLPQLTKFACLTRTRFSEEALVSFVQAKRPLPPTTVTTSTNAHLSPAMAGPATTTAVLRYVAFAESRNGHLGESDLLRASSAKQKLQPFADDGLVIDIHKYYDVNREGE